MGEIYQGRYVSGIVAGMKLQEMITDGTIKEDQAKIGYVAAFPYAEVISGYTAFILGVRSIVPTATMDVCYTNTWTSYKLEKSYAEKLIENDCVIISQHSDTIGPAVACENAINQGKEVFHVGYNQSMIDMAPITSLTGSRIDWSKYIISAIEAVINDKTIENHVEGNVHGQDISAGFDKGWVQMLELNNLIVAPGTKKAVEDAINELNNGKIKVFKGDYKGVNPNDESDVIDLKVGYEENKHASAPSFNYVLEDVVNIVDFTNE
jgi:basic membrane protein A